MTDAPNMTIEQMRAAVAAHDERVHRTNTADIIREYAADIPSQLLIQIECSRQGEGFSAQCLLQQIQAGSTLTDMLEMGENDVRAVLNAMAESVSNE